LGADLHQGGVLRESDVVVVEGDAGVAVGAVAPSGGVGSVEDEMLDVLLVGLV
jgi:hypothetical protein